MKTFNITSNNSIVFSTNIFSVFRKEIKTHFNYYSKLENLGLEYDYGKNVIARDFSIDLDDFNYMYAIDDIDFNDIDIVTQDNIQDITDLTIVDIDYFTGAENTPNHSTEQDDIDYIQEEREYIIRAENENIAIENNARTFSKIHKMFSDIYPEYDESGENWYITDTIRVFFNDGANITSHNNAEYFTTGKAVFSNIFEAVKYARKLACKQEKINKNKDSMKRGLFINPIGFYKDILPLTL